jgi:hypothetical protein
VDAIGADELVDMRSGEVVQGVDWRAGEALLESMMRRGERVCAETRLSEVRQRVRASLVQAEDALFGKGAVSVAMPRALWNRRMAMQQMNAKQTKETT